MTLRLILTRHGKSSWDDITVDDHSRPLNKRGRLSAQAIGKWMSQRSYQPGLVLCSTSERTRETWAHVQDQLSDKPVTQYEENLYLSAPDQMLNILRSAEATGTVMMIAHNPGCALMANALAEAPPTNPQFDRYPTCATTVLEFDLNDWSEVGWGLGRVVDFVVPASLV